MKQILQNLSNGEISLEDVPCPLLKPKFALIKTSKTLVSVGTERMLVDFGKANLIDKARSQPEKVKMVLERVKTDGLSATYAAIKSKLDQPLPLGYCNVGTILESTDPDLKVGCRVVSNGYHAEVVSVSRNLIAEIPDNVDDESATFTVVSAIALQGIRLVNPTIGECVVVTGLGLIGQITVQILRANGCRVLGIDFDSSKCALAKKFGAEVADLSKGDDPVLIASRFSKGRGVDAVIITASSKSNVIIHQAATMCRKRGRIVLVGVIGLELSRADFYEKELSFQVSCSYGPGRHDDSYELLGNDYPFGFVRWTEQRNFEAVLDLIGSGAIDVQPLISNRFDIDNVKLAYENLDDRSTLGIVLDYASTDDQRLKNSTVILNKKVDIQATNCNVSFIGGGNYASRILIPAFKKAGASLNALITSGGISAVHHGRKYSFEKASSDFQQAFDDHTDIVVIATQHNLHAAQAIAALNAGKHVFIEKPLALNHADIDLIGAAAENAKKHLMVGYNRRFAPQVEQMKKLIDKKASPKTFIMTMNAGYIPSSHWTQDPVVGGGRIIGEACHYIDLMRFLAGAKIQSFNAIKMGRNHNVELTEDKAIINLAFADGSIGSIHYFANGDKSFPKERIEVFCDGAVLQLDNFRTLKAFGWSGFKTMNLWSQDKGQNNCVRRFIDAVNSGGVSPISLEEILEVARVSVDIAETLRNQP